MKNIKMAAAFIFIFAVGISNLFAQSQMPSKVISNGGEKMGSANYGMHATVGQTFVGNPSSVNYISKVGFWYLIDRNVTAVEDEEIEDLPYEFKLEQNYPNPFSKGAGGNPTTRIKFSLKENSFTQLIIYDMLGREVANLINGDLSAGNYEVVFNANQLASGIYIYRIIAGNFIQSKKMNLIK